TVVIKTSRGWRILGIWLLTFCFATTAIQMRSTESIYQMAFGTGATPEGLWREYQQVKAEVKGWRMFNEESDSTEE
ncbi:MAG: hypothetical protein NT069_22685, partial [Planctomycetota bacterium]|nr:hypothetical protein [Planctomycetota bacterium]